MAELIFFIWAMLCSNPTSLVIPKDKVPVIITMDTGGETGDVPPKPPTRPPTQP